MTPAARIQAAIEILDQILDGDAAEKALTGWARRSRYAGSKDRAAIRDHVFTALRCKRSHAALGGAYTGRGLMLGAVREEGLNENELFSGEGYGPQPVSEDEGLVSRPPISDAERLDIPDWLWPLFEASQGSNTEAAALALRKRAPVHLRVNAARSDVASAVEELAKDGIVCVSHPGAPMALEVKEGARRIRNSESYLDGVVELQDAASQAVVEALPLADGMRVLDYCAGGGGKSLAIAARAKVDLFAHDAAPHRMKDLPQRANRAGANVAILDPEVLSESGPFDLVLCDAPCSGSGSWRRSPEGKWSLSVDQLADLRATQAEILDQASGLVAANGILAYATCSILNEENSVQIQQFIERTEGWNLTLEQSWPVQNGTDGFYVAVLTHNNGD